ncbi:pilus assembly protein CpaD [Erythrobacter sp. SG61-1L]|uniref:CpaD family pilus assembly protein n=1 Tax=Erythrobacter sp. SG61-1L TaxID=1603897 RepID=UPI0006C8F2E2|nr:CpaD family pilus assembly protein [Erythrobacter sp. SG61-1L]KPL69646.1 pilus assembly protein CpaD [Erythrobacter sp. SG61-1L]
MRIRMTKSVATALALTLGLSLTACASEPTNRSLDSVKQPVVERSNYTFDVTASPGGLAISEQQRLNDWFKAMELGYGDRVSIDDPMASTATREKIAEIAARYGILVSDGAPVTEGSVIPGTARIVVTRSKASVPGCPDWGGRAASNYNNGTNDGFGCSVNSNLSAMVADPEHLIHGAKGTGETVIMTSNKAIASYRDQKPTGTGGLNTTSTSNAASGGN